MIRVLGRYAAALAVVGMATLIVLDLNLPATFLKMACFAASVCWSFTQLGKGPGFCAMTCAALATDYWVFEPLYTLSLDSSTVVAMASYGSLGLLVRKFGSDVAR